MLTKALLTPTHTCWPGEPHQRGRKAADANKIKGLSEVPVDGPGGKVDCEVEMTPVAQNKPQLGLGLQSRTVAREGVALFVKVGPIWPSD